MAIYRHTCQETARPHRVILISLIAFISATLTMIGCTSAATSVPTAVTPIQTSAGQNPQVPAKFPWSPDQQRQRELAIQKRDRSLLPQCPEEYFAWRDQAKIAGGLKDRPPSTEFWDNPGCEGTPDAITAGPETGPGPAGPNSLTSANLTPVFQPEIAEGWKEVEAPGYSSQPGFALKLPEGWELRELQGIDSYVGEIVGDSTRSTSIT